MSLNKYIKRNIAVKGVKSENKKAIACSIKLKFGVIAHSAEVAC